MKSFQLRSSTFNKLLVDEVSLLFYSLVIPTENVTPETVTYWRCLVEHLLSLGVEGEEHLDKVLPTGTNFSKYVSRYILQFPFPN